MSARLKKSTMPDYTINLSIDIWHVYNLIRTQLYNLLYTDADNCVYTIPYKSMLIISFIVSLTIVNI